MEVPDINTSPAYFDRIIIPKVNDSLFKDGIDAAKERTRLFLESCWGVWSGSEYDGIEDMIMSHKHSKPIIK